MITKIIPIGDGSGRDIDVTFKASAATLRIYRSAFGRDMLSELQKMDEALSESADSINSDFIENLAWIMAGMPDNSVEKWLERFGPLEIILHAEDILSAWYDNLKTTAEPKNEEAAEN